MSLTVIAIILLAAHSSPWRSSVWSMTKTHPKFARVYLAEKALLLEVLKEGDAVLLEMAHSFMTPNAEVTGGPQAARPVD